MMDNAINQGLPRRSAKTWRHARRHTVWLAMLGVVVILCIVMLEARFWGIQTTKTHIGDTPVTLYKLPNNTPAAPVVVAHGFAGSRQMMDQISVSLARQGFFVASVDLPGHGRNNTRLSPDITNLDGTTAQLAKVMERVANEVVQRPDTTGPISFVGHSMASDIVVRASQAMKDVGGVVAVSMYSPAVTAASPRSLLVVSGAFEGHLRQAGLETVRQIAPKAGENETVSADGVIRRTAVAPYVGHVGVLYAPTSLEEITNWLQKARGSGQPAALDRSGWIAGVLLVVLVLFARPLAVWLPKRHNLPRAKIPRSTLMACILLPFPVAALIAMAPAIGIAGNAAFGSLAAILCAIGVTQIVLLNRAGVQLEAPDRLGLAFFISLSLVFALALDRYGAAFLPTGERWIVLAGLMLGTVPLMIADSALVHCASFLRRALLRVSLLLALACAFLLSPTQLGLAFTVLPVLVLFFLVYGSIARWIATRRGAGAVALGKGVVLAWAIAASTPFFAVAGAS